MSLFPACLISCSPKKDFVITDEYLKTQITGTKKTSTKVVYGTTLSEDDKKYFAGKLGVHTSEIFNEKLYNFIKSWEGTKYVYGGGRFHAVRA